MQSSMLSLALTLMVVVVREVVVVLYWFFWFSRLLACYASSAILLLSSVFNFHVCMLQIPPCPTMSPIALQCNHAECWILPARCGLDWKCGMRECAVRWRSKCHDYWCSKSCFVLTGLDWLDLIAESGHVKQNNLWGKGHVDETE